MLEKIQEQLSSHYVGVGAVGVANAPIITPAIYETSFLKTHFFLSIPFSEWIQIGSFFYIMFLFGLAVVKLVRKIRAKDGK